MLPSAGAPATTAATERALGARNSRKSVEKTSTTDVARDSQLPAIFSTMSLRRSVIGRSKRTPLVAVTVITAGVGTAAAVPAYANSDDPAGESSMRQMHEQMPQNMARMHELMMQENRGMARMHELMMEGNPGMARMHERMMERGSGHDGQE